MAKKNLPKRKETPHHVEYVNENIHKYYFKIQKVIDFYPKAGIAYSGKVCLFILHYVGGDKIGEVCLSKKMLKELLEDCHENKVDREYGREGTNQTVHTQSLQSSLEKIEAHCGADSINKKHFECHPYFDPMSPTY